MKTITMEIFRRGISRLVRKGIPLKITAKGEFLGTWIPKDISKENFELYLKSRGKDENEI